MSGQTAKRMSDQPTKQTITGVVLCGGESSRMGTDKGLLLHSGLTWAELTASKLKALYLSVVLSVNHQQLDIYKNLFAEESLVVDCDDLTINGPLLGLLSVHLKFPNEDLFVLACDMKAMTVALLQNLHRIYKQEESEACIYSTAEIHQPLCGIYTAAGLQKIYALHRAQQLKRHSIMAVLETLNTKIIAAKAEDLPAFNNCNSPADV